MKRRMLFTVIAATTAILAGCVVAPASRPYYSGEPVMVAPPPPRTEYVGPPPATGYIWIGGYWNWVGGRHEWAPGHWESPRPNQRWVPHRWEQDGQHWRLHEGHWEQHEERHEHDGRRDQR